MFKELYEFLSDFWDEFLSDFSKPYEVLLNFSNTLPEFSKKYEFLSDFSKNRRVFIEIFKTSMTFYQILQKQYEFL